MPVGLLTLEIFIPDAHSLKDKRQVLRSLKDRLRARFNVAVAELDHQDTWQRAQVGVVTLSNDAAHLEQSLAGRLSRRPKICSAATSSTIIWKCCERRRYAVIPRSHSDEESASRLCHMTIAGHRHERVAGEMTIRPGSSSRATNRSEGSLRSGVLGFRQT